MKDVAPVGGAPQGGGLREARDERRDVDDRLSR